MEAADIVEIALGYDRLVGLPNDYMGLQAFRKSRSVTSL